MLNVASDTLDSCKVETIGVSIMTSDVFIKSEISGRHMVAELYCSAFSFSLWQKKKKSTVLLVTDRIVLS